MKSGYEQAISCSSYSSCRESMTAGNVEEHGTWRRVNWQLPAIAL
ncbi:unnamed protein product [Ascophyllum nodosum]